jgi:orc1/cdc6 family replication initiation protein
MPHRNSEQAEIARAVEPLLEDEGHPRNLLLYGPTGVGKTAIIDYVVDELKENMFLQEMYVNCFDEETKLDILYELLDKPLKIPKQGASVSEVKKELEEKVRENSSIIVIDEVDQISSGEILYYLSRFMETPVIMIANDPNVFGYFDSRVQSRMTDVKKVRMSNYSHDELRDILDRRIEFGLKDDAVAEELVSRIAEKSEGDARKAILTLKQAALNAEDEGQEEIKERHVEEAVEEAETEQREKNSDRLGKDQKILKQLLEEAEEPKQMDYIYSEYKSSEEVDSPRSKRTIRRYLKKMESYNFVESEGEASARTYQIK